MSQKKKLSFWDSKNLLNNMQNGLRAWCGPHSLDAQTSGLFVSIRAAIPKIKQQTFISHSSGDWKFKIKLLADLVSLIALSWFINSWLLVVFSHSRRSEGALWGLFYKGTNPTLRVSPPWPHHLPKSPPTNTIMLGIRFQHMNFGDT